MCVGRDDNDFVDMVVAVLFAATNHPFDTAIRDQPGDVDGNRDTEGHPRRHKGE